MKCGVSREKHVYSHVLPSHYGSGHDQWMRSLASASMNEPESSDSEFMIDADIRVARTLPARMYSDPTLFARNAIVCSPKRRITAAHDGVAKIAGQGFPFTLLPGVMDEPLLLTRDAHDDIHALSNVCTHRGTLVVEGPGHEQQLRCRDHGRRFALDGRFHSMPEFDGTANFPSPSDDLPRVALGTRERSLMVALAPALTFDESSPSTTTSGLPPAMDHKDCRS